MASMAIMLSQFNDGIFTVTHRKARLNSLHKFRAKISI